MKLSIIIPVYNCAPFLENGVNKLEQLYKLIPSNDFEIIYVNDGSTDNSADILESISKTKENITVIHQENQGSSGARNTAINIARGEYIQFLDADDYIDFNKTIPLLNICYKQHLEAISYRIGFYNEKKEYIGEMNKHKLTYNKIMTGETALIEGFQPSSICCWFFKRSFFEENNLRFYPGITHMDGEFTTRMLFKAKRVLFKDIVAYFYVFRSGSITKPKTKEKIEKLLHDEITVASLMRSNITKETSQELKKAIIKNCNSITWNLLWRFYKNPGYTTIAFKKRCLKDLTEKKLYPIKGPLVTKFQYITKPLLNCHWFLKKYIIK